jgi:hypothetical protein
MHVRCRIVNYISYFSIIFVDVHQVVGVRLVERANCVYVVLRAVGIHYVYGFHRVATSDYHVIDAYHVPNANHVIGVYHFFLLSQLPPLLLIVLLMVFIMLMMFIVFVDFLLYHHCVVLIHHLC